MTRLWRGRPGVQWRRGRAQRRPTMIVDMVAIVGKCLDKDWTCLAWRLALPACVALGRRVALTLGCALFLAGCEAPMDTAPSSSTDQFVRSALDAYGVIAVAPGPALTKRPTPPASPPAPVDESCASPAEEHRATPSEPSQPAGSRCASVPSV